MLASIESVGTDVCLLTGEKSEGVKVKMADGSVHGHLSWTALKRFLKARAPKESAPLFDKPPPRNPQTPP